MIVGNDVVDIHVQGLMRASDQIDLVGKHGLLANGYGQTTASALIRLVQHDVSVGKFGDACHILVHSTQDFSVRMELVHEYLP